MRDFAAGIRVARSLGRRSGRGIAFRLGQGAWFHSLDTINGAGLNSSSARLRAFSPLSDGPVGRRRGQSRRLGSGGVSGFIGGRHSGGVGRGLGGSGLLNASSSLAKVVGRIAAHSSVGKTSIKTEAVEGVASSFVVAGLLAGILVLGSAELNVAVLSTNTLDTLSVLAEALLTTFGGGWGRAAVFTAGSRRAGGSGLELAVDAAFRVVVALFVILDDAVSALGLV